MSPGILDPITSGGAPGLSTTLPVRDLWFGRLGLPTVDAPIAELLGSEVSTVGDSTAVGQRRVKGFTLVFPIHGTTGDDDPYYSGQRMRRQLRALMQNHQYRLAGVYVRFAFDPERNGWMVVGTASLADADGGSTLGEYTLTIDNAYRVGGIATHREGYRVTLVDVRQKTSPIDYFGQYINTGAAFAALPPVSLTFFPVGAYDIENSGVPGGLAYRTGSDGNGHFAGFAPDGTVFSWERAEGDFNKGDVVIYDRRGNTLANPTP